MLNQLYLAMPNPDPNWAKDCQTSNFHTRLWEAMLLASFREQGLLVTQEYSSPDFYVTNRLGGDAWVEAVTVNPSVPYDHARGGVPQFPHGTDVRECLEPPLSDMPGPYETNYARIIRVSPHVIGKPFAIAIADFHAPGSMMWSREALMSYLYGFYAREVEIEGKAVAVAEPIGHLPGDRNIKAGLFTSCENETLSAVIFSNAATLSKLSRVPMSFGGKNEDYRYVRVGIVC